MSQISLLTIAFAILCSLTIPGAVVSQGQGQGVAVLQTPADFPEVVVRPLVDLNPFEMSTLDRSTLTVKREERSNLVVNQPREQEPPQETLSVEVSPGEPSNITFHRLPPRTSNRFYRWLDENGVIHVTNDPDSIPSEYRRQ
jgi:hypothetical protein